MNVFIVYWHPEPKSFNGAMLQLAQETLTDAGHVVEVSDLHAMQFDPVSSRKSFTTIQNPDYFKPQLEERHATEQDGFAPDIQAELEKLDRCDVMIWQFPLWWFGLPATLKGWVDRVFAMGRTYGGGRIYDTGVFKGKRALLSLTTGGPNTTYQPDGFNGDINGILRPIHRGMLHFVGFEVLAPHIVYGPARKTDEERQAALRAYADRLLQLDQEPPFEIGRY